MVQLKPINSWDKSTTVFHPDFRSLISEMAELSFRFKQLERDVVRVINEGHPGGGGEIQKNPLVGRITAVIQTGNTFTYDIVSLDGSIDVPDFTPSDRWVNIVYFPLAIGDPCLIMVDDQNSITKIFFWEEPDIRDCTLPEP